MTRALWQSERQRQLDSLEERGVRVILDALAQPGPLPEPEYHFEQHGQIMGAVDIEQFLRWFAEHVQRRDLRWFTYIRKRHTERMWYLVAIDNGRVAQYNESVGSWWSFLSHTPGEALARFLDSGRDWWIEVQPGTPVRWARWK